MNPELKKNLSSSHYWFRALYVLFFVFASEIAATVLLFVAIGQIVLSLITGQPNARLTAFGETLAKYLYAVFNFVCCKSEEKPFPFADWPEADEPADQPLVKAANVETPMAEPSREAASLADPSVDNSSFEGNSENNKKDNE